MTRTDPYRATEARRPEQRTAGARTPDPRAGSRTADPYRLSDPDTDAGTAASSAAYSLGSTPGPGSAGAAPDRGVGRGEVARSALWVLVVLSAVANTAASYAGAATWVHLVCGAVTALGGGVLVVRKLRGRR